MTRLDWPTAAEVWADLRATRSDPPGRANNDPDRRAVYLAALEQSEQLFTAADQVGFASRPVLVFYGLSQAGRALAAAANGAGDEAWRLSGHGLTVPNLTAPLAELVIQRQGKDHTSFRRLAKLLGSPPLPSRDEYAQITLGQLWDTLPEAKTRTLLDGRDQRPAMYFWPAFGAEDTHPLVSGTVCGFPRWLADSTNPDVELKEFMRAYPHAADYSMVLAELGTERPAFRVTDRVELQMHWRAGEGEVTPDQRATRLLSIMSDYNGSWFLMPALGGNDRPLHPLLAWWAVLFALSMLARYQPSEWVSHINVDRSRQAVALETMLTDCLIAVPRLVYSTLRELTI